MVFPGGGTAARRQREIRKADVAIANTTITTSATMTLGDLQSRRLCCLESDSISGTLVPLSEDKEKGPAVPVASIAGLFLAASVTGTRNL